MPWTAKDASEYTKKADTDAKAEQWAAVANSALYACMEDGGDEQECAASAIQQANGVIAKVEEQEPGGPEMCACPDCDYEQEKERGVPCRSVECPECGAALVAKVELDDEQEESMADNARIMGEYVGGLEDYLSRIRSAFYNAFKRAAQAQEVPE